MNEFVQGDFLRKRMIELREKSGKSLSDMAVLLNCNKSTLSRVEGGSSGYKTIYTYAQDYCKVLNLTDLQTEQFLRGIRVVVTDTSRAGSSPATGTIEERLFGYNRRSSFLHPTKLRKPLSQGTYRLLAHEYQIDESLGRVICRGFSCFWGEWPLLPTQ